jgi:hypothetical protein
MHTQIHTRTCHIRMPHTSNLLAAQRAPCPALGRAALCVRVFCFCAWKRGGGGEEAEGHSKSEQLKNKYSAQKVFLSSSLFPERSESVERQRLLYVQSTSGLLTRMGREREREKERESARASETERERERETEGGQ